jgi:tetratricopeptide (TPR) repeat protein
VQALYLARHGKEEEAGEILEKLIKRFPGRIETKLQLARLVMASDPEKARALLDEGLKTASSDEPLDRRMAFFAGIPGQILSSRLHTAYGDLLEKEGNTEEAILHHRKAWDLFQYNYASAVSLVKLYKESGKKKKAKKAFKELRTLDPPNSYIEECEKILQSRKKKKRPAVSILVMEPDFICL